MVRLHQGGGYWRVSWRDTRGKRRTKNIGAVATMPKRTAEALAAEFSAKIVTQTGLRDAGKAPRLGAWLDRYLALRTDLCPTSLTNHSLACTRLREHFGDVAIDRITRAGVVDFKAWLKSRTYTRGTKGEPIPVSDYTVHKYLTLCKQIMEHAVREDALPYNPFDRVVIVTPKLEKTWRYLTPEETERLIEAAPDHAWKCAIALARYGGLRRGEIHSAMWSHVNWSERTLLIPSGGKVTTKRRTRSVPIEPRLYTRLEAAFADAPEGAWRIFDESYHGMEHRIDALAAAAGLEPWAKPMHTMRKNRETDWLATYPVMDVCQWMGNSPSVAFKHYHQTHADTMARVTGAENAESSRRGTVRSGGEKAIPG